jgi:hypothetical protein
MARSLAAPLPIGQLATRKRACARRGTRPGTRGGAGHLKRLEQRMTSPGGRPLLLRLRLSGAAGKTECRSMAAGWGVPGFYSASNA